MHTPVIPQTSKRANMQGCSKPVCAFLRAWPSGFRSTMRVTRERVCRLSTCGAYFGALRGSAVQKTRIVRVVPPVEPRPRLTLLLAPAFAAQLCSLSSSVALDSRRRFRACSRPSRASERSAGTGRSGADRRRSGSRPSRPGASRDARRTDRRKEGVPRRARRSGARHRPSVR